MAPLAAISSGGAALAALAMTLGCAPVARAITSHLQLSPQLEAAEAKATQLQASLVWKEVSPVNRDVYMSISVDLGYGLPSRRHGAWTRCNSGYLGAQFHAEGYQTLLWSMSGREEGQVVPVGHYCNYDCFDCSNRTPNRRDFQCKRDDYTLSIGVTYTFTMQMEMQNASGAMWSVTMVDPTAADVGHPIEVGRVFFKDREFGLPEDTCRVLGVDPYVFQEYWNRDKDHTTRASWSAITFSGVMKPQDTDGYCQGGAMVSLLELQGLTRAECKGRCAAEERCRFASYTDRDFAFAPQDGSHCMLFDGCGARSTNRMDLWWTYEKVDAPPLVAAGFREMCQHFKDQNCDDRFAVAAIRCGAVREFELDTGRDVRCAMGAVPDEIESDRCPARGAPLPAGPAALALRGAAPGAAAGAAAPGAAGARGEGAPLFP